MKNLLYVLALGALTVVPMQADIELRDLKNVKPEILNLSNITKETINLAVNNPRQLPPYWMTKLPDVERVVGSVETNLSQMKDTVVNLLSRQAVVDKVGQGNVNSVKAAIEEHMDDLQRGLSRLLSYLTLENMDEASLALAKLSPEQREALFESSETNLLGKTTVIPASEFYAKRVKPSVDIITKIDLPDLGKLIDRATKGDVLAALNAFGKYRKFVGATTTIVKNFVFVISKTMQQVKDQQALTLLKQIQQKTEQIIEGLNSVKIM